MLNKHLCIALGFLLVLIVPSVSFTQKGTLERGEITSAALGSKTKAFYVYLPPSYETSQKQYPSFYVLHGYSGNETSLAGMRSTLDRMIENGEIGEMIAVFPDGDNSWYVGEYEPYITRDLVDHVDAHYRTIPDRNSRGITGHSMGGFGAMHLALKFPEVFAVVVPQAGRYDFQSVDQYLNQPVRLNGIKIVHGRADDTLPVSGARALDEKLTDLGMDHVYVEHGGGHWFINEESLPFLSDHLHPLREIAHLREAVSATTTPDAIVVGASTTVVLSVPPEATESLRRIILDLSPLGIPSELPLEHSDGGGYSVSHTITPSWSGRYPLPVIMETAFEWDLEDARYHLLTVEVVVYPAGDEYLYQDQMGARWEAETTKAELDLKASDVVHSGSYSHAVTLEPRGGVKYVFEDPDGFSTFGYTGLEFWIHPGTSSTEQLRFVLSILGKVAQYRELREDLGITLEPDVWQVVSIPLEDLGLVDVRLKYLKLDHVEGTFYIDNLAFVVAEYGLEEAMAIPERIKADGTMSTLLTVQTMPGVLEPGAPPPVTIDLTPIGGSPETPMSDDGTGGDKIAGDGIYTIWTTVPPEIPTGLKDLVISSRDRRLRVDRAHLPLAVLPAEEVYVYRDEIAPMWRVRTGNVLSDPSATSFAYDGEHSLEISLENKIRGGFVSYSWDDPEGFNVFGYEDLVFHILVTEPEQDPKLMLTPVAGNARQLPLREQLGEPGVWQEIRIPLEGLAEADFRLKGFSFQPPQESGTFYLDNVRFVPEEVEIPTTAVEEVSEATALPLGYSLSQNVPNPFNPITAIAYHLPQASDVTLTIYTVTGQKVAVLVDAHQEAGHHAVRFDGSGFGNGVYLYRLETGGFVGTRRMILMK